MPYNKITGGGDFNVGELHSREYWYGSFDMPMIVGYNDAWDEHDTRQTWSAYMQDDIHLWDDRIHITPGIKYIGSWIKDNDALGIYYFPPGSIHAQEHFLSPTIGCKRRNHSRFHALWLLWQECEIPRYHRSLQ